MTRAAPRRPEIALEPMPRFLLQCPTMRFFWPIYVLSATVATVGVYVAAPLVRPYVPEFLKRPSKTAQGSGDDRSQSGPVLKYVPSSVPVAADTSEAEGTSDKAVKTEASGRVETPGSADASDSAEELPPALNGIYLAQRGDKPGWGITHQRTAYYQLDGSRAGEVQGGVLLDFRGTRTSSKGGMVECVLHENGTPSAPVLLGVNDAFLFTGDRTKLSARQLSNLQAYYALRGKIAGRKNELLQVSAAKNPFFEAYQAAYKTLMAQIDRAKELTAQRDRATELDKMRIEDQLREMKMKETRLRTEYDALHLKFRTWKQQHANELAKPEDDPFVKQWSQQMADLRPRVPGLVY